MERCSRRNGCPWERQRFGLTTLDAVAWQVFNACQTQWEIAVGMGGAARMGLKYDQVRVVAEAHGYALNHALLSRIQRLEALSLMDESKRRKSETDNDGDVVN